MDAGARLWLGALAVLALAKVVSLGVTAFIFDVTRPKLLQLAWFRALYDWVIWLLAWAHALVDPIKRRIKRWLPHVLAQARLAHAAAALAASAGACTPPRAAQRRECQAYRCDATLPNR